MYTTLSAQQLDELGRQLQNREQELRTQLQAGRARAADEQFTKVASEAPDNEDASVADVVIDVNQAAIGRDASELRLTQEAMGRIEGGGYGLCLKCGKPIEFARLEVMPAARYDARCFLLRLSTASSGASSFSL